jgi:hypothetical protein
LIDQGAKVSAERLRKYEGVFINCWIVTGVKNKEPYQGIGNLVANADGAWP